MRKQWKFPALVILVAIAGCGGSSDKNPEDKRTVEPGTQQDGKMTVTIPGGSAETVTMSGAPDSKIKSAAVTIPPGALSVDTTINVEEGTDISVFGTDLTESSDVPKVGPAVMVTPEQQVDPTGKILVTIPADKGAALADDYQIAVIYQVKRYSDGKTMVGLAIGDQLKSVTAAEIQFESPLFGIFQVVRIPKEATAKEMESDSPMLSKSAPLGTAVGHWILGCRNLEKDDGGGGGVQSVREWIAVKPNTVLLKVKYHDGFGCVDAKKTFDVHMVAKFEISDIQDEETQVRNFDMTPQKIWFRPLTPEAAQALGSSSFCGVTTWTANTHTEITTATPSASCSIPKMNQVYYATVIMTDEIFIAPDSLSGVGTGDGDGSSADKRYTGRHEHPNIRTPDYPFEDWVKLELERGARQCALPLTALRARRNNPRPISP
jgi:hypothetical protein